MRYLLTVFSAVTLLALASCQKTVHVTEVRIEPTTLTLGVGDIRVLSATTLPANAENTTVKWRSGASSVATVDYLTGEVKAIAAGTAVITAVSDDGDKTATCTVTVHKNARTMIIRTTADMEREMDRAKNHYADSTYIATWAGPVGVTNESMHIVGDWKKMDTAQDNITTDYNGHGIYAAAADQTWAFADWRDKTASHKIVADPATALWPSALNRDDAEAFAEEGYGSVTAVVSVAEIDLSAEDAARFDECVVRLLEQYPAGVIRINTKGHAVVIKDDAKTLPRLGSLHVPNPDARIQIDGDLDIEKLALLDWDLHPGGNARWIHASGIKTELYLKLSPGNNGNILIPYSEENMITAESVAVSGYVTVALLDFNNRLLPLDYKITQVMYDYDSTGGVGGKRFNLDASIYGFFLTEAASVQVGMIIAATYEDLLKNSRALTAFLSDNDIQLIKTFEDVRPISGALLWCNNDMLSKTEAIKLGDTKIYDGSDIWVNPDKR